MNHIKMEPEGGNNDMFVLGKSKSEPQGKKKKNDQAETRMKEHYNMS